MIAGKLHHLRSEFLCQRDRTTVREIISPGASAGDHYACRCRFQRRDAERVTADCSNIVLEECLSVALSYSGAPLRQPNIRSVTPSQTTNWIGTTYNCV